MQKVEDTSAIPTSFAGNSRLPKRAVKFRRQFSSSETCCNGTRKSWFHEEYGTHENIMFRSAVFENYRRRPPQITKSDMKYNDFLCDQFSCYQAAGLTAPAFFPATLFVISPPVIFTRELSPTPRKPPLLPDRHIKSPPKTLISQPEYPSARHISTI